MLEVEAARLSTPRCTASVETEFLDVVLEDPDLLQGEFEAIIAASWPDPPNPPRQPAPPALMPGPCEPHTRRPGHLPRSGPAEPRPAGPRPETGGRQRSPPAPLTAPCPGAESGSPRPLGTRA